MWYVGIVPQNTFKWVIKSHVEPHFNNAVCVLICGKEIQSGLFGILDNDDETSFIVFALAWISVLG